METFCEARRNHQAAEIPATQVRQPLHRPRPKQDDSVELYLGDEFIGLIYLDEDEGERSYMVQISILDIDLDEVS